MPAPIFALGSIAFKGAQAAGKTLLAGWKAGKVGAGNNIAGNTTTTASYGSSTIEPQSPDGETKAKDYTMWYVIGGGALLAFFLMKKK